MSCVARLPHICPVPPEAKRPLGIDAARGVGTAYEGCVRMPRANGGVKRGWTYAYVIVCDFKLFLYECTVDKTGKPLDIHPLVAHVLDMRDPLFDVCGVSQTDVIHANKADLPRIFRVTTAQCTHSADGFTIGAAKGGGGGHHSPVNEQHSLLMADTAQEKSKWVIALNELHKLLKKSNLPDKRAFAVKELFDPVGMPLAKSITCACVLDADRLIVGTADQGLFCVDLRSAAVVPLAGDKEKKRAVHHVEFMRDEHLIVAVVGKEHIVRLIPVAAVDGRDVRWVKIEQSKGCHCMAIGANGNNTAQYLCVAVKKTVSDAAAGSRAVWEQNCPTQFQFI